MEEEALEQRVVQYIRKNDIIPAKGKLVVAVSGGADSVCLLYILHKKQKELGLKLHVAHLNHQLRRGESDADAEYVYGLARNLGIPATIDKKDVSAYRDKERCSLEEAAREVRYRFLADVAQAEKTNYIAVGHTRDDQVETILMHIIRGSGTKGLCGLQPLSQLVFTENQNKINIIRPLLVVSREETSDYCKKLNIKPRADTSNTSHAFLRNRIRHELIPLLKGYNPEFDNALLRLSGIAKDELSFIEDQIKCLWNDVVTKDGYAVYLDKDIVTSLAPAVQKLLFRRAVVHLIGNLRDIGTEHIEAMVDFLVKPVGKKLSLPKDLVLYTEYECVVLAKREQVLSSPFAKLKDTVSLKIPGKTVFPGWLVEAGIVQNQLSGNSGFAANFDLDKTGTDLLVRHRKPGDYFQPLGMTDFKKLQDFMVDSKIPRSWRGTIPILCSPGQILWVVGWRIDERVKVTEDTKNILNIKFTRQT